MKRASCGASPEEWTRLDTVLGLRRELLPTVRDPAVPPSPHSYNSQPVLAYVSLSVVYILDEQCSVVAYGHIIRRVRA